MDIAVVPEEAHEGVSSLLKLNVVCYNVYVRTEYYMLPNSQI